jgi:hypothetical protein
VAEPVSIPAGASSAAIEAGIGDAVGAISGAVSTIALVIAESERDPCRRESILFDRWQLQRANLDQMIQGVNMWSQRNYNAVDRSIRNWGKDPIGDDAVRSVAFSDYLAWNGYIDAIWAPLVSSRLRQGKGDERPSSTNSGGVFPFGPVVPAHLGRLGKPGAYITADGEIRGSGIVDAWERWTERQEDRIYSASAARPNWRERLLAWTGRADYRAGITPERSPRQVGGVVPVFKNGFLVGQSIQRVNALRVASVEAGDECSAIRDAEIDIALSETERQNAWTVGQISLQEGQLGLQQSQIDLERLAGLETTKRLGIGAAALGLLAVVYLVK